MGGRPLGDIASPGPYALGDVNGDGHIDTGDALLISRHASQDALLTGAALARVDIMAIDWDTTTIEDIVLMLLGISPASGEIM